MIALTSSFIFVIRSCVSWSLAGVGVGLGVGGWGLLGVTQGWGQGFGVRGEGEVEGWSQSRMMSG